MVRDKTARKTFTITPHGSSYDMACNLCMADAKAWDWKRNALTAGYGHSFLVHKIDSPRGRWSANQTFGRAAIDKSVPSPVR